MKKKNLDSSHGSDGKYSSFLAAFVFIERWTETRREERFVKQWIDVATVFVIVPEIYKQTVSDSISVNTFAYFPYR
jgi:hypothetical protein